MKLFLFLLKCSRGVRHSRAILIVVIVCGVASGLINTGLLAIINISLRETEPTGTRMALRFIGFCIALPVARFISEVLLMRLAAQSIFDLRIRLCRRILAAPLRTLEELGPHRLLATLTDDIPSISGALTTLPLLCMHSTIVVGCLIYLGWLSSWMLLGVLAFMALAVVSYQFAVTKALHYFRRAREQWDILFKDFRALTEGSKELKLHRRRREAFLSDGLGSTAHSLRRDQVIANTIYNAARSWGQVLVFVLIGLLLFVLPEFSAVSLKARIGYTLIILYLMTPMEVILNSIPALGRAKVAVQKLESLGLLLPSDDERAGATPRKEADGAWQSLELKGVTHTYYRESEDDNFILGPIDLKFRPGELVFMTGGNGSGKTTFAKLLTGLYAPESGEITLDDIPVTAETRDEYRQNFSVVFSDFYLFERLLGLDAKATDARAHDYLRKLHLDHKVKVDGGVLSTTNLSHGQRKRLALLTAYLEDRRFYIFDEWASDQDPLFKEIFYYELLPELKSRGKTVLVISHDEKYYHVADRIAKLNYGKLEFDRENDEFQSHTDELFTLPSDAAQRTGSLNIEADGDMSDASGAAPDVFAKNLLQSKIQEIP
jgi:putative ATP-binding cassette transporter